MEENKKEQLKAQMGTKISGSAVLAIVAIMVVGGLVRFYVNSTWGTIVVVAGVALWAGKYLKKTQ